MKKFLAAVLKKMWKLLLALAIAGLVVITGMNWEPINNWFSDTPSTSASHMVVTTVVPTPTPTPILASSAKDGWDEIKGYPTTWFMIFVFGVGVYLTVRNAVAQARSRFRRPPGGSP